MRSLLTLAFLLMFLPAAFASGAEDIVTAETYLNGISTLKSRFTQTANDGTQVGGVFMLKRPGRLRFEYDAPVTDFIVADGTFIYYYDGQMKQQTSAFIGKSLADFFLRPEVKLSGDISVADIKRADKLLQMTLVQAKDPLAGTLTLFFSENPMELKKWRIVDAQGLSTQVDLYETQQAVHLDSNLFHYYDPERRKSIINK